MAESRPSSVRWFTRAHAFVLAAVLCYGIMTLVVGYELGRRRVPLENGSGPVSVNVGDALLRALTRPTTRPGAFEPDPLEAFMEVYGHLKSKYVEPIGEAQKKRLAYGAIKGMLRELGDPYTRFMEPKDFGNFTVDNQGRFKGIGAMLGIDRETHKIQVIRVFANHPAAKAGLKAGDYVVAIDGQPTADMSLDVAVSKIRGEAGTKVKLTIESAAPPAAEADPALLKKYGVDPDQQRTDPAPVTGKTRDVEIVRADIDVPVVEKEMLSGNIGYVYLAQFNEQSYKQLREQVDELVAKGAKGILLDLRNNPGGLLEEARQITSLFVKDGAVVYIQERDRAAETLSVSPQLFDDGAQLPLVVLVNRFSASASEIVSGALQDHQRATIVGETTYGKGLVQTVVPLSDKSAVAITTAKYLTPNKRDINKKGIKPDVAATFDLDEKAYLQALASGKPRDQWDSQVKKAIEVLRPLMK